MAQTSKLISTISFNSPKFLQGKVFDLVRQGVIEYAHWIYHEPEEDEKKAHAHLLIKPNRRLDTSALRNSFVEPCPDTAPLGVLPFRPSKVADWLLYSVHDVVYLMRKGEERKCHYSFNDLKSTDVDLLDEDWRDCHRTEDSKIAAVIELAQAGKTWLDVVKMGFLPINQIFQYKDIFFTAISTTTDRGGRKGHDDTNIK